MKRRRYRGSRLARALDIEDLRQMALSRLPGFVSEYLEGGSEDEVTLRRNREAFDRVGFIHRALVDVQERDLSSTLFGEKTAMPMAIGPTGFNGLLWKHADIALARAAKAHGIPFTVSTVSSDSLDAIVREAGGRLWFQLYILRDRQSVGVLIDRARDAGCEALVLTADAPAIGNRTWDTRNFAAPLELTLRAKLDVLTHLRWLFGVLLPRGIPGFGNLTEFLPPERQTALDGARYMGENTNAGVTWDDIARMREQWPRKLVVKGVLSPADVTRAAELGVDGVVLSNHGGRQLDGDISGFEAVPGAVQAAAGKLTVMVDGGFRRGSDVAKAIALGADAVLLGRAALYGVAAGGEEGAHRVLDVLRAELDRVMTLLGCGSIADLDDSYLAR